MVCREQQTGILIHNAVLLHLESFARGICPPLLQLALLVVKTTGGVKGVLETCYTTYQHAEDPWGPTVNSCDAT